MIIFVSGQSYKVERASQHQHRPPTESVHVRRTHAPALSACRALAALVFGRIVGAKRIDEVLEDGQVSFV